MQKWGQLSEHMYQVGLWGEISMNEWVDLFVSHFSTSATKAATVYPTAEAPPVEQPEN